MANIDKRGNYVPRRQRERRAYQLAVGGATAGVIGVVSLVLAVAGVLGFGLPVIALILAALCYVGFQRSTSGR
jgi:CHASE2 domain-containing sensor protein